MALFKKENKKKEEKKEEKPVKDKASSEKKSSKVKKPEVKNASIAYDVLIEPWITEKSHAAMINNKYAFKVSKRSDKQGVKMAVEGMFSVNVEKVAIVNIPAKKKFFGRREGVKSGYKKAIVTIKDGQSIELFKGAQ